jgi:hypothetical protein
MELKMALEPPSNSGDVTKDDILDVLNEEESNEQDDKQEDNKKVKGDTRKTEPDTSDDEDTEDDEKPEDDEETDEDDEDKIGDEEDEKVLQLEDEKIEFPKKKEILKEFPNLFKKFPSIEHAIYRDRQFSEVFATPDDAKEASDKAQQLDVFSEDIGQGNIHSLFKQVHENDPNTFYGIVDNILDSIGAVDQRAYHHVIGNVVKFTIMAMADEAKTNQDAELMEHAAALNKWVFRSEKFDPPKKLTGQQNPEINQVQRERMELAAEKFESAREGLQKRVDNQLRASIDNYIDPEKEMSGFVKKHASDNAFTKLEELLGNDRVLRSTLNRLWRSANGENYSSSSLDKIRAAYLSKAKIYLRQVIRDSRNEALKESRKRTSNGDQRDRRGHIPVGRTLGSSGKRSGKEIPKGMSNKDFIMSD